MDGSAANASGQAVSRDGSEATSAQRPIAAKRNWLRRLLGGQQKGELRVYQHSNLLYWWPLWLYGYVCAALTYAFGIGIKELAATASPGAPVKVILFYPSPWMGISYIGLILFIAIFTNVRARGVYSFVLLLLAAGLSWLILKIPGIEMAFGWASLVRVYLNLAFYMAFSTLLLLVWLFVIVFVDHFTWWRFSPGQVIEEHRIGQATGHAYNAEGMRVRRLPDDLFRHRILGLGLFGFRGLGTGDFMVHPTHGEPFEIQNVWRANRKQRGMESMIATRVVESNPRG
jgi:hypothetical protein